VNDVTKTEAVSALQDYILSLGREEKKLQERLKEIIKEKDDAQMALDQLSQKKMSEGD